MRVGPDAFYPPLWASGPDYIYNEKGIIWSVQTEEGKKTMSLLSKYSDKTREQPTPESYSNLIKKWMRWSDLVDDQNYKSWLKS